jgi:hypothetical protein
LSVSTHIFCPQVYTCFQLAFRNPKFYCTCANLVIFLGYSELVLSLLLLHVRLCIRTDHRKKPTSELRNTEIKSIGKKILTYLLTSWNRVFLEMLTGFQLVKKFSALYATRKLISAFTRAYHLSISYTVQVRGLLYGCFVTRYVYTVKSG